MQLFDVKNVPLAGKNLVEASAGTGKTYSIAILVLRLLIEAKKEPVFIGRNGDADFKIEDILIVTYTKAAVAELQDRMRIFLRQSVDYCAGLEISDVLIKDIIDRQAAIENKEAILERLKKSLFGMDEANILTIHGFAQKMLNEFAFETKQPFNPDVQNDISAILENASNEFYRKEITTLSPEILDLISPLKIKLELLTIFSKILSELTYYPPYAEIDITLETALADIKSVKEEMIEIKAFISNYLNDHPDLVLKSLQAAHKNAPSWFQDVMNDVDEFVAVAEKKSNTTKAYLKLQDEFWDAVNDVIAFQPRLNTAINAYVKQLKWQAVHKMLPQVRDSIQKSGIFTFDALILNLKNALIHDEDDKLGELIRKKFPAVFIDEFQDTDRTQFEIFNQLFIANQDNILFLIGDPKQSIYSFRNADIDSYLEAKSKVNHIYTMNTNYRSTQDMIAGMNEWYAAIGHAEGFGFDDDTEADKKIAYETVNSKDKKGALYYKGQPLQESISLHAYDLTGPSKEQLSNKISFMLDPNNNYQILDKNTEQLRPLRPNDFGVLVSSHANGKFIKSGLQGYNIPAVQILDEKVLQTEEALHIQYILEAMLQPNMANIKKALYLTFLEMDSETSHQEWIFQMDENDTLELFAGYKQLLLGNNVYQAFLKLMDDFSVSQRYSSQTVSLRKLSNIVQIINLMNEQQYLHGKDITELHLWLKKSIQGLENEGDAYLVQLESDEDAVKISTIHSSKGLEYNIVFIFGIHRKQSLEMRDWVEFKQGDESTRYFTEEDGLPEAIHEIAINRLEEEQMRFIYVAMTRSVYSCNIFFPTSSHKAVAYNESVLQSFMMNIERTNSPYITIHDNKEYTPTLFQKSKDAITFTPKDYNYNKVISSKTNWWKMSFSALTLHESEKYDREDGLNDPYNQFIFNILPRGAQAGIILHNLFENLDFTIDYQNDENINWFYKRQFESFDIEDGNTIVTYEVEMRQMAMQVLKASITVNEDAPFSLYKVSNKLKMNELEFAFNLRLRKETQSLMAILDQEHARIQISEQGLEGMMNGFIDLFFEHNGKYYILDWKSNYIGYRIQDYTPERLEEAMTMSNYHLQYMIYTVAAYKYLKSKKADFDYDRDFGGVIYVFLRGARAGSNSGIYTKKPKKESIEKMIQLFEHS